MGDVDAKSTNESTVCKLSNEVVVRYFDTIFKPPQEWLVYTFGVGKNVGDSDQ